MAPKKSPVSKKLQLPKSLLKLNASQLMLFLSIVIYIIYQYKPEIQNNNTLDLIMKLVLFAFVLYAGFNKRPLVAIVVVIIMGLIFIDQTQVKKPIAMSEIPPSQSEEVSKSTKLNTDDEVKVVEKYGKYGLTNWDEANAKDKYDTTLKTRLRMQGKLQKEEEMEEDKEGFAPLQKQPTLTDMQYMENQLQKALTTNILNKEELENVEAKMITTQGLEQLQNNTFSNAPDKYHAPVFVKASQNYGLTNACSTQADCSQF